MFTIIFFTNKNWIFVFHFYFLTIKIKKSNCQINTVFFIWDLPKFRILMSKLNIEIGRFILIGISIGQKCHNKNLVDDWTCLSSTQRAPCGWWCVLKIIIMKFRNTIWCENYIDFWCSLPVLYFFELILYYFIFLKVKNV